MSQQQFGIAVQQRTAITRMAEDTMTSPYLDYIRSTRETIEDLIGARELELAKTTAAAQRQCIERDLAFLQDELARIDGRNVDRESATDTELLRDECPPH